MDKCRICLTYKKKLISIFEKYQTITHADMMCILANIKITKNDGVTELICQSCRQSLAEAYEMKMLIERSDAALNGHVNGKKLYFNHINDIKTHLEVEFDNKHSIVKQEDFGHFGQYFTDSVDKICYNNTIIKKMTLNNYSDEDKPIPVLEFLISIKDDPDEENSLNFDNTSDLDNCGGDTDDDSDYVPADYLLKNNKTKRSRMKINIEKVKKKVATNCIEENTVCIKPVYLTDLKLVYEYEIKPTKQTKRQSYMKYKQKVQTVCPYCGIMVMSVQKHMLTHTGERNFKCDICNKAFFTSKDLSIHKKRHSNIKDFKCDQCIAAFNSKNSLDSHKSMHSTERKYVCDICSKGFKRLPALRRHKMMHNSANRTIMCDLCNMSFYTKYQLRHHMRVHTRERPYNCEICSQPYSYKHDFNRHCLKKHGVFFKRRSVFVMNEEVLKKEQTLMKDLMLRVNGILKDDKPINPFEGPQAVQAFEQAVKALKARQIPIDFHF